MATEKRLKSKMKKSDPENYTIHDFLNEGKSADTADSRFDESMKSARGQRNYFVLGASPLKLGNLYREVSDQLAALKGWKQKKDDSGRFHLILGGPRGSGIPFKRFAQLFKWDYGITPHCNYFRGHVWLTQKVKLIQTLRQAGLEGLTPESYLFFPSSSEDNETDDFRAASESGAKRAVSNNTWIAKATDASRGERTLISGDYDEIVNHLEAQDKTSPAWSVQRYISNPLLLPGGRKFDLRYFVLVDSKLNFYICSQGAVKTCSAPFSMDDLCEKMAHLSNATVQGRKGNDEFPIEQLQKWIASEHGVSYESAIMEPVQDIIAQVAEAAKPKLENVEHADFTSFQVFAFDFAVDSDLKVWFLEVSAPTEFPEDLVKEMATDVVNIAIKPAFADEDARESAKDGAIFQALQSGSGARGNNNRGNNKK